MRRLILAILLSITFISARRCHQWPKPRCITSFKYKVEVDHRRRSIESLKSSNKRNKFESLNDNYYELYGELDTTLSNAIAHPTSTNVSIVNTSNDDRYDRSPNTHTRIKWKPKKPTLLTPQQALEILKEAEDKLWIIKRAYNEHNTYLFDDPDSRIWVDRLIKLSMCIDKDCHSVAFKKLINYDKNRFPDITAEREANEKDAVDYINDRLRPSNVDEISNDYPFLEFSFDLVEDYSPAIYTVFIDQVDWDTAKQNCEALGYDSTLASITSESQQKLIESLSLGDGKAYWIGARKENSSSTFQWIENLAGEKEADLIYANWNDGEPNNVEGVEDCGSLWGLENVYGRWNDASCAGKQRYICQTPKYRVFDEQVDWQTAREKCEALGNGSTLATITSETEQGHLESLGLKGNDAYWIGASRENSSSSFKWTNHSNDLTNTNWNDGEPNNAGGVENCVNIWGLEHVYGKWNDAACASKMKYICQFF